MNKTNTLEGFDVVIDVVSAEYYAEEHISGAINICGYETAFAGKVEDAYPDKKTKIVVYGPTSAEGKYALSKLLDAGYENAVYLAGGMNQWSDEGGSVEITRKYVPPKIEDGEYELDLEKSKVLWIGRNKGNSHMGTIDAIKGGVIVLANKPTDSEFVLDFNTIKCIDLAGDDSHDYLIKHLHSADFFLTSRFPHATFVINHVEKISGRTQSELNYDVSGELTMRGQTHTISFEAAIHPDQEGGITAQAHVDIDRTDWGMVYGSERFLRHLGMHILQDEVTLDLKLYFTKK